MAEMVGLSRSLPRRNGGFFAALKTAVSRLTFGRGAGRIEVREWPDYLLRDIGIDRASFETTEPRSGTDWLRR